MSRVTPITPAASPRATVGRPRKLDRRRIVAAALETLEQEGFGALSMRSLAARLGVNHATLYNYVRHIEDVEAEALAELMATVPMPSRSRPEPLREQMIEHLLALRELQRQHPHVLHAPLGSPTWISQLKIMNRVLHVLNPDRRSLARVAVGYSALTAMMANSAERVRSSTGDYAEKQRRLVPKLPLADTDLVRRLFTERGLPGPRAYSLRGILDYLVDRLLPELK